LKFATADPDPLRPMHASDARDKPLFTPGPLTTSRTVKQAMLRDVGSRDNEFIELVARVRTRLLDAAGASTADGYEAVLMQGSGTFAVEAVLSSAISPHGRLLAIVNGSYGERIAAIARRHRIETVVLKYAENALPDVREIEATLQADPDLEMVAVVHCETTSGVVNPIEEIGRAVRAAHRRYFVDSMSAFGAVPFDFLGCHVDYLVSSANKCIEGVPGFGFCLCRRAALEAAEGWARTLSLDLLAQWRGLEKNGQFRFTPPTHALLAFDQALAELEAEGGVVGRAQRYRENHETLVAGMRRLGFREYVPAELQGYIITSFRYPEHPQFNFDEFYLRLSDSGFVIYPGKVSDADCFRIGTIGRIYSGDVRALLHAIEDALVQLGMDGAA